MCFPRFLEAPQHKSKQPNPGENLNRQRHLPNRVPSEDKNGSRQWQRRKSNDEATTQSVPWHHRQTRAPMTNDEKIKSEMCRNLSEFGNCTYGKECRYAHDPSELRNVERHPKHKTQLCMDYHGWQAFCSFGTRCSYIHKKRESATSDAHWSAGVLSPEAQSLIDKYTRYVVRILLIRKRVPRDYIASVEALPSALLRLWRRALTSPEPAAPFRPLMDLEISSQGFVSEK